MNDKHAEGTADIDLAVIIVNYNTAALLRGCLRSLRESRRNLTVSICVVDNASQDDSVALVQREFADVQLIANPANLGFSAGNNVALRRLGFGANARSGDTKLPRYVLLLNPDTIVPPTALAEMVRFMDEHPRVGVAGPRMRRPDGSLDRACRRSFPTPTVSFYRMIGLSRLLPKSRRFNAYNLEYLAEDAVHPVDSVVGAYMQLRAQAIQDAGLLDERFFMYGEDLDWAKRIKDAGWEIWYNGAVEITHVKEAASSQSAKSRVDFYEAMWLFYQKHYRRKTNWLLDKAILVGIVVKGGLDVTRHLLRYCRSGDASAAVSPVSGQAQAAGSAAARPGIAGEM